MTGIDRRLFVFGLCGVCLARTPVGRINSVFAATKISPDEKSVLIVVDVQNCFLPGGSLAVKDGEQVVPIINRIARAFTNVVMTQDWHTPNHISFASAHPGTKPFETIKLAYGDQVLWPDHCVQGTSSADISKDISIPQAELIVRKGYHKDMDSYSAFFEADHKTPTGLGGYLNQRGIDKAFVTGLATDFCVAWTAIDARNVGFETYVVEDACRGIDTNGIPSRCLEGNGKSRCETDHVRGSRGVRWTARTSPVRLKCGGNQCACIRSALSLRAANHNET